MMRADVVEATESAVPPITGGGDQPTGREFSPAADPDGRLSMGVWVEGQPMDVHGHGVPLPDWSGLRSRLTEPTEPRNASIGTGEGVLVGLIDSGIVQNSWLNGGYLSAPDDFEKEFGPATAESVIRHPHALQVGHGTFAAGLILQQAPAAGVWVERVLNSEGDATANRVMEAARALAHRGVHVINMSLGTFYDDYVYSKQEIQRIVDAVREIDPNIVIVAAAGNLKDKDERRRPFWPAALPGDVVAVGAVDEPTSTRLTSWSNGGDWLDVAAPGTNLLSTYLNRTILPPGAPDAIEYKGWALWSGTSFASAVVSGAIAALATPTATSGADAQAALARLRTSAFRTGETRYEAEGDVPPVPVINLLTWERHEPNEPRPGCMKAV